MGDTMRKKSNIPIKIRHISIKNYKGIDSIELDFPTPRMLDDPDIIVMGSRNGLGKTSIIECCSLLLLSLSIENNRFKLQNQYSTIDVPDFLIRAGEKAAEISGNLVVGDKSIVVDIRIDRNGVVKISGSDIHDVMTENDLYVSEKESDSSDFVRAVCGFSSNPIMGRTFLLFHSYRKVQEGNPELGVMVSSHQLGRRITSYKRAEVPMSTFKLQILRSMMGQANLFEFNEDHDSDETIRKLNELVKFYAGGVINKLRPSSNNTIDFRVTPIDGKDSFTFDGLSSGQKEIISTLFLIWYHTKNNPCVVFIDEPELHLNSQWHRSFINKLVSLAPQNQYIMATHSEDIMDSVNEDRRLLLLSDQEESK